MTATYYLPRPSPSPSISLTSPRPPSTSTITLPRTPSPPPTGRRDSIPFPPSISQRNHTPCITLHRDDDDGDGELGVLDELRGRSVRKVRSVERTRTWAEEVERQRRRREVTDGDDPWDVSAELFDKLVLPSPHYTDRPRAPHSPMQTAARVFEAQMQSATGRHVRIRVENDTSNEDRDPMPPRRVRSQSAMVQKRRAPLLASETHRAPSSSQNKPTPPPLPALPARVERAGAEGVPPKQQKSAMLSIDEIVKRHSTAVAAAQMQVVDRARKEIARTSTLPRSPPAMSSTIMHPPTSSSRNPVTARSDAGDTAVPSESSGSDVWQDDGQLGEALLAQLERPLQSAPLHTGPSSSSPPRRLSLSRTASTPPSARPPSTLRPSSSHSLPPAPAHSSPSTAAESYLLSPHLNRIIHIARPHPDPPLRVSLADVGDPRAPPTLLFLGIGCVRHLAALLDDLCRALHVRLICIDRWGYGDSDQVPQEERSVSKWAGVVERVLAELGVGQQEKVGIIGHSAGAVYAMAMGVRLGDRVRGKIKLLAPWVGGDIDGGYKWLKWVPNGVIRGAVAAEWRLQSYRLGKPPPTTSSPSPSRSSNESLPETPVTPKARPQSGPERKRSLVKRTSQLFNASPTASSPARHTPASPPAQLNRSPALRDLRSAATTFANEAHLSTPTQRSVHLQSDHTFSSSSSGVSTTMLKSPDGPNTDFGLGEGFDSFATDLHLSFPPACDKMPSTHSSCTTSDWDDSSARPRAPIGPDLTLALTRVSHAHSEPGTTADLLAIILQKDSPAWGVGYHDLHRDITVWWGEEDERVSERGIRWLEGVWREKKGLTCEVRRVRGEGHNLMSSGRVMWEVLEGVAAESRGL